MSKSAYIRAALAGGKLPLSKLIEKTGMIGRKKAYDLCCYLRTRGEITIDGSTDDPVFELVRPSPPPQAQKERAQIAQEPHREARA
jgi:hypothetical protein